MSSLNSSKSEFNRHAVKNEVGTLVRSISAEQKLMRLTLAHMLWEDQFYVDGETVASQLTKVISECRPEQVAADPRSRQEVGRHHAALVGRR